MPRFSVVIPSYNRVHLLDRCLSSLVAQHHNDWEVIVADDGSSDGTKQKVRDWIGRDCRIRYVSQENRGAGAARNLGASHAEGEWILFLDSDDEVLPDWLFMINSVIAERNPDVVCCGCDLIGEDGELIRRRLPGSAHEDVLIRRGYFFTGTFAVRATVFSTVGGYHDSLPANQHSELRMRLLPMMQEEGWLLECIPKSLVLRYSHGGPSIRGNSRAVFESGAYILENYGSIIMQDPNSYRSWAAAVGVAAAAEQDWQSARRWFLRCLRISPGDIRNWARLLITAMPGLRDRIWRRGRVGVPRS